MTLNVQKGEVICIIGPSGAGKSTYLRSLNQLETITSGKIFIKDELFLHREHNRTIHRMDPVKHKALMLEMGMVFQSFNLFPHKTVLENVVISQVLVRKKSKEAAQKLAKEIIQMVGLSDKLDVYPSKLSGGQQQRVAIARALAMEPEIMLFGRTHLRARPRAGRRGTGRHEEARQPGYHHARGHPRNGLCPRGRRSRHLSWMPAASPNKAHPRTSSSTPRVIG